MPFLEGWAFWRLLLPSLAEAFQVTATSALGSQLQATGGGGVLGAALWLEGVLTVMFAQKLTWDGEIAIVHPLPQHPVPCFL